MAVKRKFSESAFLVDGELSDPATSPKLVEYAITCLGTVDAPVNNAGVTIYESALTATTKTVDFLFGLDYRAPILLTRVIAEHMIAQNIAGGIVNATSFAA